MTDDKTQCCGKCGWLDIKPRAAYHNCTAADPKMPALPDSIDICFPSPRYRIKMGEHEGSICPCFKKKDEGHDT